jgi:hypothetical protein
MGMPLVAHRGGAALNPIDAEGTPTYPRSSIETRRLRNYLARVQDSEHKVESMSKLSPCHPPELGEDLAAQGLHSKRLSLLTRRLKEEGCRESPLPQRTELTEEPLGIPQQRAFAVHAPQLLQEGEGDDLRIPPGTFQRPPILVDAPLLAMMLH